MAPILEITALKIILKLQNFFKVLIFKLGDIPLQVILKNHRNMIYDFKNTKNL